jgi:hypothetical protein
MVGLHRAGCRILRCIRERRIVEDERRRRDTGSNDEGLNAKAPPKMLDSVAVSVGLDISLIPREAKRRVRNLDHEEVETGIGGRPLATRNISSAVPSEIIWTFAWALGRQVLAPFDTTILKLMWSSSAADAGPATTRLSAEASKAVLSVS